MSDRMKTVTIYWIDGYHLEAHAPMEYYPEDVVLSIPQKLHDDLRDAKVAYRAVQEKVLEYARTLGVEIVP